MNGSKTMISVLGDSISTLAGYQPEGYRVFYQRETCMAAGIQNIQDTWWGQVISYLGGTLLVNNSWSGSRVCDPQERFPAGCSDERTGSLHCGNMMPDVIFVYMGFNDWADGISIVGMGQFQYSYVRMLEKLRRNYPKAEIFCCTLNTTYASNNLLFRFREDAGGRSIVEYNEAIQRAAVTAKCKVLDLYRHKIPCDTIDGSHPNAEGMRTLAELMIRELPTMKRKSETQGAYPDTIELFVLSKNNTFRIKKTEFSAGRGEQCEFRFDREYPYIARFHATFYYENAQWYIKDNNSTNGTWLNNEKIEPNKKYRLRANDVIDFAHSEKLTFFKGFQPVISKENTANQKGSEAVQGITLQELMKKNGKPLPINLAVNYAKQIVRLMQHIHSQNPAVLHCAINPRNLICTVEGRIKLVNFESAQKYVAGQNHQVAQPTRGYAAPEQYAEVKQTMDPRTDIFSLGMTLHYLVTGMDPTKDYYHYRSICKVNPNLPIGLEKIIDKCVALNPNERYQTCMELLQDLDTRVFSGI